MSKRHPNKKRQKRKNSVGSFVIDFGCHRGKKIREIPVDYVRWLATECEDVSLQWIASEWLALIHDRKIHDQPSADAPLYPKRKD